MASNPAALLRRPIPFAAVFLSLALLSGIAVAAWAPEGVDLARPRLLMRTASVVELQARVAREPYRTVLADLLRRARQADDLELDDHAIDSERIKSRAARNLSFVYAIDRTASGGDVVPFPSAADRQAVGDRVRDLLLHMYTRSRLAVAPPLGGWDRDISTSEELLSYATAFDTLLGAGYDFGSDETVITEHLVDLASELYDNFRHPETVNRFTNLHQNNHRSKSGAAMVVAAIAVADYTPAPGTDPRGVREPALWVDYGIDQVDLVMRFALVTGDGAYGEGAFYRRFALQNLIPFARAWDQLTGGRPWTVGDLEIPSLWRHPTFLRGHRWMLDLTLPDGTMAPFDDANPGRAFYFGALPSDLPDSPAYAWRWANAPPAFETDGNIDLGPDSIVLFDDNVAPAPPTGSPTAFYVEGGNAVFRSDWSTDAVVAVVQAEHDTASEFGRNRDGLAVAPQSHEHAEPGAFTLNAFGERLALDPGYFSFAERIRVNMPADHNLVLVDGEGPVDYLSASSAWLGNPTGRPPTDGQASLSHTVDADGLDAVKVTSRYGQRAALIARRFVFPDERYLAIADLARGTSGPPSAFTWLIHGNGGGSNNEGNFELTAAGGTWTRARARLDVVLAADVGALELSTAEDIHEDYGRTERTHVVLRANAAGTSVRTASLIYPTRTADVAPETVDLALPGAAAVRLIDPAGDRRVVLVHRTGTRGAIVAIPARASGMPEAATDGTVALFEAGLDGRLRLAWADGARVIRYDGTERLRTKGHGSLGLRLVGGGRADIVADTADESVTVSALPFTTQRVDGACGVVVSRDSAVVTLNRERRFTLHADPGNAVPAADAGADRRVELGTEIGLDGASSCDADGDALTPRWELVSAPAGSAWSLGDAASWTPVLSADRVGPYRVRLVVTDTHGAASRADEVLILAGPACADGVDNDLDGRFDSDDVDCDEPAPCPGDCSDDGVVTVDELVLSSFIAAGGRALVECAAADLDGDGAVSSAELGFVAAAVHRGCDL